MGISGSWQNSLTFEKKNQSLCEISIPSSLGIAVYSLGMTSLIQTQPVAILVSRFFLSLKKLSHLLLGRIEAASTKEWYDKRQLKRKQKI